MSDFSPSPPVGYADQNMTYRGQSGSNGHGSSLAVTVSTGGKPLVILAVNYFRLAGKLENAISSVLGRSIPKSKISINKIDS
jgi:hypothetical protein